jgi:hypothetical protein
MLAATEDTDVMHLDLDLDLDLDQDLDLKKPSNKARPVRSSSLVPLAYTPQHTTPHHTVTLNSREDIRASTSHPVISFAYIRPDQASMHNTQ